MRKPLAIQLVGLVLCGGLIALAATRIAPINAGRERMNVRGAESPVENAPPEYAFAVQALGAFRGLVTDIAFIRAEQLKELGRYYDAMQLHLWICDLQPRFPSVWEYAAWNMSWNISVTTFTPQERWNWVYNGVKLLRDQGIPLNPRAVNLYKQLAWTFNNKMSENIDEHHYAYKCQWAYRMHVLLGPRPSPLEGLDLRDLADALTETDDIDKLEQAALETARQNEAERRERARQRGEEYVERAADASDEDSEQAQTQFAQLAALDRLTAIRDAPETLAALYEAHPTAREMVAQLRRRGLDISDDPLTEDTYWREGGLPFALLVPYQELAHPATADLGLPDEPDARHAQRAAIDDILGVTASDPAGTALIRYLQKKILAEVYKLDVVHMIFLTREFGPIDWRAVDSQSLYWTSRGLIAGGETLQDFRNDKTNTARILFFSLRNLFLYGNLVFEPNPGQIHRSYLSRSIEPAFAEPMHQAFVSLGRLIDPDPRETGGAGDTFKTGHINFLSEVIRALYLSGLERRAAYYFNYLQETYPTNAAGDPNPALAKTLEEYVIDSYLESMSVPGEREIMIVIASMLRNAYDRLSDGDVSRYAHLVQRSGELYESYMRQKAEPGYERLRLAPYTEIQADALFDWLREAPVTELVTLRKARLWERLPVYLRQRVYDPLRPMFEAECEYYGFDVQRAFPEPPGMAEFREAHPERYQQRTPEGDVQTLPRGTG